MKMWDCVGRRVPGLGGGPHWLCQRPGAATAELIERLIETTDVFCLRVLESGSQAVGGFGFSQGLSALSLQMVPFPLVLMCFFSVHIPLPTHVCN